jgi:hypothetical protein
LPWSSLWVEISTLVYEMNTSVQYPYTSDKTNAQKSEISTKINAAGKPTDMPVVVLGKSVGIVG